MSLASQLSGIGFSALLATQGVALNFRGIPNLKGIVNYVARESGQPPGKLTLNDKNTSSISMRLTDLGINSRFPSSGETITDEFGFFHRIKRAKKAGQRVICECEVSNPV